MDIFQIDELNFLHFRATPWDAQVIKALSNEIIKISYSNEEKLNLLLEKFEDHCLKNEVKYTILRINANDQILRKVLQINHYYFAESSLNITKTDIQKTDFVGKRKPIDLVAMRIEHLPAIKKIAFDDFHYGRLIEDPFITESIGRQRSANWIDDLWNQQNEKYVWQKNDEVLGFHFQKVFADEYRADLILSGVRAKESMLAVFFWGSFLEMLKQRGFKKTNTMISTANLGVLNLYIHFQFRVKETLFGFHKLR